MCSSYTLGEIDARCDKSIGGIKEILIANFDDVEEITNAADTTAAMGLIDKITLADGKHFVKWTFRPNTGSYTSTTEKDLTIGNQTTTTELALQFSRADATKRVEIQSALNANAIIIVRDMYDQYVLMGRHQGIEATNVVMQSGTANTDLSGFTMTFTETSYELPRYIDTEKVDIDSLIA